jgi:hypothetical protein
MKNILIIMFLPAILLGQNNPVELGDVRWFRSMEAAQEKIKA